MPVVYGRTECFPYVPLGKGEKKDPDSQLARPSMIIDIYGNGPDKMPYSREKQIPHTGLLQ